MRVRCTFQRAGAVQCGQMADDARLVDLADGDQIVALMCLPHCQAYDTILWADWQRRKAKEVPE